MDIQLKRDVATERKEWYRSFFVLLVLPRLHVLKMTWIGHAFKKADR